VKLEDISVRLRARGHWEAIDLGAAMMRHWWRPIFGAWCVIVVPFTVALVFALSAWPVAALAVVWWLKPLYDRIVLHVLARAVFGAAPGVRETLRSLPSIVRTSSLAWGLTLGRASLARSFVLPVAQLEGQRGAAARARNRTLSRRAGGHAANLLAVCIVFETALFFALGGLAELLTPPGLDTGIGLESVWEFTVGEQELPWWMTVTTSLLYVVALSIIEPMYVAGGFALYLNRRTTLEAWDLELAFRRMAARHAATRSPQGHRLAGLVMAAALLTGTWIVPPPAAAAEPDPKQVVEEVLASPDFGEIRKEKRWQPRQRDEPQPAAGRELEWLADLMRAVTEVLRILAYALIAVVLILFVRFLLIHMGYLRRNTSPDAPAPEVLFGLDVRPESLPDDLAGVAAALARQDPIAALSLLYRGALATLIHRDRLTVEQGDTEGDCVRRVERERPPPLGAYFRRLVGAWTAAAYGHRLPADDTLVALCHEWPQHFARQQAAA